MGRTECEFGRKEEGVSKKIELRLRFEELREREIECVGDDKFRKEIEEANRQEVG